MKKVIIAFLLTLFVFTDVSAQQNVLVLKKWITDWTLLGPIHLDHNTNESKFLPGFKKDFLKRYGGESKYKAKPGKKVKLGKITHEWKSYSGADSVISLDRAVSKESFVAAYAYTEVIAEKEGTYILSLGTNDGGILWLNGEKVWEHPDARGCKPDDDLIPVTLNKGKNSLMLKIEEKGNKWEFCIRILPFDIATFIGKQSFFDVVTLPSGISELWCIPETEVVNSIFTVIKLDLYTDDTENRQVWSGVWTGEKKTALPVKSETFRPYLLKINARGENGEKWEKTFHFFSGQRVKYTLFEKGRTTYRIIVGNNASESEVWAAKELQKSLSQISGAEFSVESDASEMRENEIIIGYNRHSKELLGSDFVKPDTTDESFVYKNIGSDIVLIGGAQRGTMYAVFTFLEREFGVRWYTPKVTAVPEGSAYIFDYIRHSETPTLKVRNDFYYEAFDPEWAAHNKINGAMGYRKQYGGIEGYWAVHTFYQLMPPDEFYSKHPEYYSLIDGERVFDHAQLCLTNPDVLDIITERLKKKIKENPENLIYSVSQNDWRNPCQCDKCQAIVQEEMSEAGVVVWFVNQVAKRIKKDYPDKLIGTLAYQYTRKPPKNIIPEENVVIRLCSIECCFAHDIESCPQNHAFMDDLKGWSSISPHLYIWDSVVNFSHYIMPYPNFRVLQPNIKTFVENKSIGIMEQGAYQSRGGEFAELRAYLISKLLWNVDCDADEIIYDFMYGYYGRSGQYVREYFDLLHDQITPDTHIHLGLRPDDKIFTEKFIEAADKIFNEAETVADNDEIRKRVEVARLPLMYLKCKRDPVNSKVDGTYDRFNEIVKREGISHLAEAGKVHMDAFHEEVNRAK